MSDYCVCTDCGCKHLVWERLCPYCKRIAELEDKIYDAYELGQDDARSNDIPGYGSEPYKDKAQVLAALKESTP